MNVENYIRKISKYIGYIIMILVIIPSIIVLFTLPLIAQISTVLCVTFYLRQRKWSGIEIVLPVLLAFTISMYFSWLLFIVK